jgi:putative nucleotidyltransferase with HDIG domain
MATEIDFEKQNWALSAHAMASSVLVRSKTIGELIEGVCGAIVNQPPYILAWVGIKNNDALKTVTILGSHGPASEYADGIDVTWSVDAQSGRGPTGSCIRSGLSVPIMDCDTDPSFAPWRERAKLFGIHSVISVPITDNNPTVIGALTIYASIPDAFGSLEITLFETLAKEIGYGLSVIEKQRLLDDVIIQRDLAHDRLVNALRSTIEAMSKSMEWRDPYTAGHQKRVALISEAIAKKMGWDEERIRGLFLAALVHDLGKIAAPSEILTKPSKLSDIEMSLIKEHPETGYEILKDIPFPWQIAMMVRQHHERLDGSGYPHGLKANEILIEARILAVADTIEAISTHRPYRPSLGTDKAIEQITLEAGTRLDPDIVTIAIDLLGKAEFLDLLKT